MTLTMPRTNPLLGVLVFAFLVFAVANIPFDHGASKHGAVADQITAEIEANGPIQTWCNPETLHIQQVCQINDKFGIQVIKKIDSVPYRITAFLKEKMKTINDVMRYLQNSGSIQIGK